MTPPPLLQRVVAVVASFAVTYGVFSAVVSLAGHPTSTQVAGRDNGAGGDRMVAAAQPR